MIDRVAERNPDALAIRNGTGESVTFASLVEDSVALAALLADLGTGRGASIAILGSRSASTITSIIGVVRSAAAYVPLDPTWPVRRLVDLLEVRKIEVLITDRSTLPLAQAVSWSSDTVSHIICPDITVPDAWRDSFHGERLSRFFDEMLAEEDPARAAGFNLRSTDGTDGSLDLEKYRNHVCRLVHDVEPTREPRILEIGAGAGTLAEVLAPTASCYTATDPSSVSVERCVALGSGIDAQQCFAHEIAVALDKEYDLCLLASTAQFFPGLDYLLEVVAAVRERLAPDGVLVLADLPDVEDAGPGQLGVPKAMLRQLSALVPGVSSVEIRMREPGSVGESLAQRYDAVVRYAPGRTEAYRRIRGLVHTGAVVDERRLLGRSPGVVPIAEDPCYTIFTSGSTGGPKGVLVSHRSLTNLVDWLNPRFGIGPTDTILHTTSFCFDLSVYDIFGILAAGASIRLASEAEVTEPDLLLDIIHDEGITIWDSTPGVFGMILSMGRNRGDTLLGTLRVVMLSGDWIPVDMPNRARERFGDSCTVVAMGGATECTVWSNVHIAADIDPLWPSIPYGRPITNVRYYVLDEKLRSCAVDVEGDLYIAGECVALGYVERPGLTASAFLADPWAAVPGQRMYRTGDRACWLQAGELQFRGRLDDQVKVRGYRIELGEVRRALVRCESVIDGTVVTVGTKTGPSLVGVYVPATPKATPQHVKEELRRVLPTYMIPERIVQVESIPLTRAGKTNREQLLQDILPNRPFRTKTDQTLRTRG
ncbi:AMP-binding protein [Actinomyces sp. Marseille-P3109]|uniref:AMP-binding protein n=1 Tax=Actinomyces sp. Marseille-P3109 TaxID=2083009 RepID=UPI00131F2A32|nr:AMP-binding protein [Actinomyces sp. Marseille-P3109]